MRVEGKHRVDLTQEFNRLVREKNILRRAVAKTIEREKLGEGLPWLMLLNAMENTGGLKEI